MVVSQRESMRRMAENRGIDFQNIKCIIKPEFRFGQSKQSFVLFYRPFFTLRKHYRIFIYLAK